MSPPSSTVMITTPSGRGTRTPAAWSEKPPEYRLMAMPDSRLRPTESSTGIGYHAGSISARVSRGAVTNPVAMPLLDAASSAP